MNNMGLFPKKKRPLAGLYKSPRSLEAVNTGIPQNVLTKSPVKLKKLISCSILDDS